MSLAFVPIYLDCLGPEAYGLIGIFASLQAMLALLDMGLSTTLNRSIAQSITEKSDDKNIRNTVKTFEIIYWLVALVGGIVALSASYVMAYYWLNPENISSQIIWIAFAVMSVALIFQFPISLYTGGILGLQQHFVLNVVNAIMSTLKGLGAVILLLFISQSIIHFFVWQLFVTVLHVFTMKYYMMRLLPSGEKGVFSRDILQKHIRFALGVGGIGLTAVVISQIDKIILSKLLSLEEFGYYTFAALIGVSLVRIVRPIFMSYFPLFSQLIKEPNKDLLISTYHKASYFMGSIIIPIGLFLCIFSYEILYVWTSDTLIATKSFDLVSIIALGTLFNGFANLPYGLALASGWTSITFYTNLVLIIFLIPSMYFMTNEYGVIGAAIIWLVLNVFYVIFNTLVIHKRLIPNEHLKWIIHDNGKPFLIALLILAAAKWILPPIESQLLLLVCLGSIYLFTALITALNNVNVRANILKNPLVKGMFS